MQHLEGSGTPVLYIGRTDLACNDGFEIFIYWLTLKCTIWKHK